MDFAAEKFEEGRILNFVNYNKFPLVTTLTEMNSARVYSSPIKTQVSIDPLFGSFEWHTYELDLNSFNKMAKTAITFE